MNYIYSWLLPKISQSPKCGMNLATNRPIYPSLHFADQGTFFTLLHTHIKIQPGLVFISGSRTPLARRPDSLQTFIAPTLAPHPLSFSFFKRHSLQRAAQSKPATGWQYFTGERGRQLFFSQSSEEDTGRRNLVN